MLHLELQVTPVDVFKILLADVLALQLEFAVAESDQLEKQLEDVLPKGDRGFRPR